MDRLDSLQYHRLKKGSYQCLHLDVSVICFNMTMDKLDNVHRNYEYNDTINM